MKESERKTEVTEPEFYDCAYFASMDLRYLNNIHSGRFRAVEKIMPIIRNKKTLDIGCGGGGLTNRYFKATDKLIGIDFSPDAIKFGKMRYPHLNLKQMSVFELSDNFKPAEFDVVIANDIIEHVYDHDSFMENCKSVLADNGYLIIGTDLDDAPVFRYKMLKIFSSCLLVLGWSGIKFLMLRILEIPQNRLKDYHENHVKTVSQKELISCLEKHGFQAEKILVYNLIHVLVRDLIFKLLHFITRNDFRDHQLVIARKSASPEK